MKYRQHHDFNLSEIGVGCYALSGVYGKKDIPTYKSMLVRAYELGVNFFDTAEAYGEAERILGETIKPFREDVYIATKVSPGKAAKPKLTRPAVKAACERSLKQLSMDTIDLYQVHFDDPDTPVEETLAALEDLVQEGKIRHYGVGHLPAERVEEYLSKGSVFSIMMELSAVERSARTRLLPLCKKYGAGALAFSITGRGLLTGRYNQQAAFEPGDIRNMDPLFQRERLESGRQIAKKLAQLAHKVGKTPVQVAIAWVLAQPEIICALVGPSTPEHIEENVGGSGWSLAPEDLAELEDFFAVEQAALQEAQIASVRHIVNEPLPADNELAFVDLVYACETAITAGMFPEEQIIPVFYDLFALRKSLDRQENFEKLAEIQKKLFDKLSTSHV